MPKAYPPQFKQQCVDAVLVLGKTREEVAREYEVSASALGRWVAAAQGTQSTGSGSHRRKAVPDSQDPAELSKRVVNWNWRTSSKKRPPSSPRACRRARFCPYLSL